MCRKPKYTPKTVRFEKTNKLKHKFVKKQISKSQISNYKNKYQLNKNTNMVNANLNFELQI